MLWLVRDNCCTEWWLFVLWGSVTGAFDSIIPFHNYGLLHSKAILPLSIKYHLALETVWWPWNARVITSHCNGQGIRIWGPLKTSQMIKVDNSRFSYQVDFRTSLLSQICLSVLVWIKHPTYLSEFQNLECVHNKQVTCVKIKIVQSLKPTYYDFFVE